MEQETQGGENNSVPVMAETQHKSTGPLIGIIIIIAVIILGGLYFWGQRTSQRGNDVIPQTVGTQNTPLPEQSNSDDTTSIEADLNAVNFDGLGNELNSIDAEAQTAQ